MSLLRNIFKRSLPTKLGRWRTGEHMKIINRKAQLATDDNCGSNLCLKEIKEKSIKNKEKIRIIYELDHLVPYVIR